MQARTGYTAIIHQIWFLGSVSTAVIAHYLKKHRQAYVLTNWFCTVLVS